VPPDYDELPVNPAITHLRHVDAETAAIRRDEEAGQLAMVQDYVTVPVDINSVTIPVKVPLAPLRAGLGLPPFPLYPVFRPPADGPSIHTNMPDHDHPDEVEESASDHGDQGAFDYRDQAHSQNLLDNTEYLENVETQLSPPTLRRRDMDRIREV